MGWLMSSYSGLVWKGDTQLLCDNSCGYVSEGIWATGPTLVDVGATLVDVLWKSWCGLLCVGGRTKVASSQNLATPQSYGWGKKTKHAETARQPGKFFPPAFQVAVFCTCQGRWAQTGVKVAVLVAVGVLAVVQPTPIGIQDHRLHFFAATRTVTSPQGHLRMILLAKIGCVGQERVSDHLLTFHENFYN